MNTTASDKIIRIGGASGAWGDSSMGIEQLLGADVDYLMMDYLAEVTMSLLARARMKDANAGYPPDFIAYLKPHLPELARRGIRVASNAGGVNPVACQQALQAICREMGLDLKIAVVEGDDLMPMADTLRAEGIREWVSGEPLPARLLTANAYLGATPVAKAFAEGADIVITGRCADSALALGILMHEFGWKDSDYNRLSAGSRPIQSFSNLAGRVPGSGHGGHCRRRRRSQGRAHCARAARSGTHAFCHARVVRFHGDSRGSIGG